MEVKKIYFDMDGVLADFDDGLRRLLNMEPQPQEHQTDEIQNKMWADIRDYGHFYMDLNPMEGAVEAFKILYEKYGSACEILTGCPKEKRGIVFAREDKVAWIRKYFSKTVKINLVLREEKQNYVTGRDCILVDDYKKNTDEWVEAGGTAILFTNWKDVVDTITKE